LGDGDVVAKIDPRPAEPRGTRFQVDQERPCSFADTAGDPLVRRADVEVEVEQPGDLAYRKEGIGGIARKPSASR
jgi:hypothetical protein